MCVTVHKVSNSVVLVMLLKVCHDDSFCACIASHKDLDTGTITSRDKR